MADLSRKDRHPGWNHLNQLPDHFIVRGPNGTHECLVLELLGPSVADMVESYYADNRLPAGLAKSFARQALEGLDLFAKNGIGHGDIHTRNLAIEIPGLKSLDESSLINKLGNPDIGAVRRMDDQPIPANIPSHIVQPASLRKRDILSSTSTSIRIIDFSEAFFDDAPPKSLHTPLAVRAPEVVFGDALDHRVDLWSAGCLIFELVAGQPPFDTMMLTPPLLVQQMLAFATAGEEQDKLPERWQAKWQTMDDKLSPQEEDDDERCTLREWLEEVYFDEESGGEPGFTREDISRVADLVSRLLRLEPERRATAREILDDEWFG